MKLSEIASPDTRLFAKSEFGPASDEWPALSFSSHKIATDFANTCRRDRDFVLYVGPRAPISTRDLVPAESWERATRKWGIRWEWSLPIVTTYDVAGLPRAA
jgi:hypothetical protein